MVVSTLECRDCGAALALPPQVKTATCRYCASPSVVARPPSPDRPDPTFAIGFVVPPTRALELARRFVKTPWFAPEAFRRAPVEEIVGAYLPAYLYSAMAESEYQAEIGENYTVTESYTAWEGGKSVRKTRRRTKTEWRHLAGHHATYVDDRVVTASQGIPNEELEAIEPYDLRALASYSPAVVSGWLAEEPSLSQDACLQLARQEATVQVGRELAAFMPGDKHRSLQHRTQLSREHLALVLLPIWVLPIRYAPDKPTVRLLVNGQTGAIFGQAPTSWWKVGLAIGVPLVIVVGGVVLLVGLGVLAGAIG